MISSYARAQESDWETVQSLFMEAISFADGTYELSKGE